MLRGATASLFLHAGVIGASFIVLPHVRPPVQAIEIVPVDIVTVSEVTNVRTVVERRTENPIEKKEEDPPPQPDLEDYLEDLETLPEETKDPVEEEAPPPPPDEAKDDKPEDIVPDKPVEKKPEEKKPDPKPEKEDKPRDALDDLLDDNPFPRDEQTLIDKAAKDRKPNPPPPRNEQLKDPANTDPQRGVGERTANEARVEAILWSKMAVCWGTVADLPDPDRLNVTVRVRLKRDGTLEGEPALINPRRAPIGDRFMGQAIDRALRAARKCQPYNLPEDDYDIWREITMNFRHERQ